MRKALIVAGVGLLLALAYGAGRELRPTGPKASAEPSAGATAEPAAKPTAKPAAEPTATASSSRSMDEGKFWQLVEQTRSASDNNTGDQSSRLEERLSKLPPSAIVEFARLRKQLDERAYTYRMWGAAYVIDDGCSDDCFRDFRAYVISLGRGPYERALANPDSLAGVAQDAETGDWENADNVAPDAYSSATGNDFPLDDSDLSGTPRGTPFDENNAAELAREYPKLTARFR